MKVGFLQFAPQEYSIRENIAFIINQTGRLEDALIVLPELFLTSYYNFKAIEKNKLEEILSRLVQQ